MTQRGRIVAVLGALLVLAGVTARYWVLATVGAALLLTLLADWYAVRRARPLTIARTVEPLVVERGTPCQGRLVIDRQPSRLPVRLTGAELVGGVPLPVAIPADTGTGGQTVSYAVPTRRRGLLDVGPLLLTREGVAGLAVAHDEFGDVSQVTVLPRTVTVRRLLQGRRRVAVGADERVEHGGTDLVGLHEYVPGDDLRRLHWATSARSGRLMIRDDADPSEPRLVVLLDDRVDSYPAGSDDFEEAVEMAAGLCQKAIRDGRQVRLRTVSDRLDVEVEAAGHQVPTYAARDLAVSLAEIGLTGLGGSTHLGTRDLDVAVAVTGTTAAAAELVSGLAAAGDSVLLVVNPRPDPAFAADGATLILRGSTAPDLAELWDRAVAR